jgi:hypothetical protein
VKANQALRCGERGDQSDDASYTGECEPKAEPMYERAASGNISVNRLADGAHVGAGPVRSLFECLKALHQ